MIKKFIKKNRNLIILVAFSFLSSYFLFSDWFSKECTFPTSGDLGQHLSRTTILYKSLKEGRIPLWSDYNSYGHPFLLYPGPLSFYLPALLALIFGNVKFLFFLVFYIFYSLIPIGVYFLAKSLNLNEETCFFSSVLFIPLALLNRCFSVFGQYPTIYALFFSILSFTFYLKYSKVKKKRYSYIITLFLTLLSHPFMFYISLIGIGFLLIFDSIKIKEKKFDYKFLLKNVFLIILIFGMGSFYIIPFFKSLLKQNIIVIGSSRLVSFRFNEEAFNMFFNKEKTYTDFYIGPFLFVLFGFSLLFLKNKKLQVFCILSLIFFIFMIFDLSPLFGKYGPKERFYYLIALPITLAVAEIVAKHKLISCSSLIILLLVNNSFLTLPTQPEQSKLLILSYIFLFGFMIIEDTHKKIKNKFKFKFNKNDLIFVFICIISCFLIADTYLGKDIRSWCFYLGDSLDIISNKFVIAYGGPFTVSMAFFNARSPSPLFGEAIPIFVKRTDAYLNDINLLLDKEMVRYLGIENIIVFAMATEDFYKLYNFYGSEKIQQAPVIRGTHNFLNYEGHIYLIETGESFKLIDDVTVNKIIKLNPEHIYINYTSENDKNITVKISYWYYWKAYMDSEEIPINRGNLDFIEINTKKGTHMLELKYDASFDYNISRILSLIFLILFILCFYLF